MKMWSMFLLFFLFSFYGCSSTGVDKETESYKKAEELYQQGHENRQKLISDQTLVWEAFDREVASLWEEGLKTNSGHRSMRKDLARLYMQLGIKYSERASAYQDNPTQIADEKQHQVLSANAKADQGRSQHYLEMALKHFKVLRQQGMNSTELDLYLGGTYMYMDQYSLAKAHLTSALESGELTPEKERKVRGAIKYILRLSSPESR